MDNDLQFVRLRFNFTPQSSNTRMHDGIEGLARLGIVEDDLRKRGAIEIADIRDDLRPASCDLGKAVTTARYDHACGFIRVDDKRAEFRKKTGDLALAGADAAR